MDRRDPPPRQSVVLAHLTESRLRLPPTDPSITGLAEMFAVVVNAAEAAPGFCWQLEGATSGQPVTISTRDGLFMITLSCWQTYASLHAFVNRSIHATAMRERETWFPSTPEPSTVLWWIGADARPTAAEGRARLAYLRKHGSSPRAFSIYRRFTPDGRPERTGRFRP